MPKIYVANPTNQVQRVCYRLDFNDQGQNNPGMKASYKFKDVASGKQEPIGGELAHPMQVDEIVQQISVYGAIPVSEINRQRGFVTYLYQVDKPIAGEAIRKVHAFNHGAQIEAGKARRQAAAIAANVILTNTVDEETPSPFTVEFEQEDVSEAGEKAIAEGYHVVHQTNDGPPRAKRAYNRKAA